MATTDAEVRQIIDIILPDLRGGGTERVCLDLASRGAGAHGADAGRGRVAAPAGPPSLF